MFVNEDLISKWKPILEHENFAEISDNTRKGVIAQLLENTHKDVADHKAFSPQSLLEAAPTNNIGAGNIDAYDPILINLVRRAMPNLISYDIMGVQPMNGPTGLIFAMRSRYSNQTGTEAFYNEANTGFSTINGGTTAVGDAGLNLGTDPSGNTAAYNFGGGMSTAQAEALGSVGNAAFAEMSFDIDKVQVLAKSRALKAEYSMELAQDLKALHGLDAENELAKILSTELIAEINRELIRTVYITATPGAASGTTTAGTFDLDTDSNGRWLVEKFKGLMFFIETEANRIAKLTRRGRGNLVITSSNVAAALRMAGVLEYNPQMANRLAVDDTGNTFAGILNGQFKVYIDPYATTDYVVVGYRGASFGDQGVFYCPYVPVQMVRAVGENTFQPKIGFKTRYGVVANPFSRGATASDGSLVANSNVYYLRSKIANIM